MAKSVARALLVAVLLAFVLLVLGTPCKFNLLSWISSKILPLGIYKGG